MLVLCALQLPILKVFALELPGSTQLPVGVPNDAKSIALIVDVRLTPSHDSLAILLAGLDDSAMCTHCDGGGGGGGGGGECSNSSAYRTVTAREWGDVTDSFIPWSYR